MARRVLKGYLEDDQQERAVINTHDPKTVWKQSMKI